MGDLYDCTRGLDNDSAFRISQTILSRRSMGAVLVQRAVLADDVQIFSNEVTDMCTPVANQQLSGRW